MRTRAALLLALLLALAVATVNGDVPPPYRDATDQTHELATLTEPEACHLASRLATFRVAIDSDSDQENGHTLYDCRTADAVLRPTPGSTSSQASRCQKSRRRVTLAIGGWDTHPLTGGPQEMSLRAERAGAQEEFGGGG